MEIGQLTQHLDVAQVVLYAFWVFFAGLIFYIRQEDRREGYPLENDKTGKVGPGGFPFLPDAKTFALPHGHGSVSFPNDVRDSARGPLNAQKIAPFAGAPLEPIGDPMLAGVGPGSYALRADVPDLTIDGEPKIVPIRAAHGYTVHEDDPDPRGFDLLGLDDRKGGTIVDIWVDQSEHMARYYEATVPTPAGERRILVPITFSIISGRDRYVMVNAVTAGQFAQVPTTSKPEEVTLLEEEKICAYYGAGTLYATRNRAEPLL
jgi:photosynthetic reaction center H subunit